MTTPANELRTAAEKLKALTSAVPSDHWPSRPWHVEACSEQAMDECPCIVAQGEAKPFDEAQDPPIQYVADAETPEHAAYIAAMHPGVGEALAAWLDSWTGIDLYEAGALPEDARHALAVARAINGGAP
jgi:hypothetical protein